MREVPRNAKNVIASGTSIPSRKTRNTHNWSSYVTANSQIRKANMNTSIKRDMPRNVAFSSTDHIADDAARSTIARATISGVGNMRRRCPARNATNAEQTSTAPRIFEPEGASSNQIIASKGTMKTKAHNRRSVTLPIRHLCQDEAVSINRIEHRSGVLRIVQRRDVCARASHWRDGTSTERLSMNAVFADSTSNYSFLLRRKCGA